MSTSSYKKNMTFKKRHSHPAKKGEFVDGCEACELILDGSGGTGLVISEAGAEVKRSWKKTSSTV